MKKVSLLVIFTLLVVSLFAQTGNNPEAEQLPSDLLALQTASILARYGYSVKSASALIGAAEIYAQTPTQPMGVKAEREKQSTTASTPEFTPATLIADAKKLLNKNDKTMIAWADEVQKSLSTKTRGAVGGPKTARDVVVGKDSHVYYIDLKANERTDFTLIGNGVSNLDLYLYDGNGNLISAHEGFDDVAVIWVVPKWTGTFKVVVKNLGNNNNRYELYAE